MPYPKWRSGRVPGDERPASPSGRAAAWSSSCPNECHGQPALSSPSSWSSISCSARAVATPLMPASRLAPPHLADTYLDGIRPASIRWSTRQQRRWGSCSLQSREIRIAARLQTVPEWVLDGVIIHELAHLLEAGHTPRFYELANSYPRQGEAHTYLEGFGHGLTTAGVPSDERTDGDDKGLG